jgi:hypothetical protein
LGQSEPKLWSLDGYLKFISYLNKQKKFLKCLTDWDWALVKYKQVKAERTKRLNKSSLSLVGKTLLAAGQFLQNVFGGEEKRLLSDLFLKSRGIIDPKAAPGFLSSH